MPPTRHPTIKTGFGENVKTHLILAPHHQLAYRSFVFLYRVLITVALVPLMLLAWKKGSLARSRFGFGATHIDQPRLWLHAASNGELASAKPLIQALLSDPAVHLLITVNSRSARELGQSWRLQRTHISCAPFDLRWVLRRVLRRWNIAAYVGIEAELWPNRFAVLAQKNCPSALVAARISDGTAAKLAKFPSLANIVFGNLSWAAPQDTATRAHLIQAGLPQANVTECIDLKALYAPSADHPHAATFAPLYDPARTILAASVHQGEDVQVLDAFQKARQHRPDLHLILAPRHPDKIAPLLSEIVQNGLDFVQNSKGQRRTPTTDITVADTLGEMSLWYPLADLCFVGGSLVPVGGHTPWEPMAHRAAILHGPHVSNFADVYGQLDAQGGARQIDTVDDLAQALSTATPDTINTMITAQQNVLTNATDLDQIVARIKALMPKP